MDILRIGNGVFIDIKKNKKRHQKTVPGNIIFSSFQREIIILSLSFKVPIVIPIFVILVAIFLSTVPIITDPSPQYFFAVGFIVVGVLIHYWFVYKERRPKWMGEYRNIFLKL